MPDRPREPGVVQCPLCGCPVQRTAQGNLADGLRAHFKTVHPGRVVPLVVERPAR